MAGQREKQCSGKEAAHPALLAAQGRQQHTVDWTNDAGAACWQSLLHSRASARCTDYADGGAVGRRLANGEEGTTYGVIAGLWRAEREGWLMFFSWRRLGKVGTAASTSCSNPLHLNPNQPNQTAHQFGPKLLEANQNVVQQHRLEQVGVEAQQWDLAHGRHPGSIGWSEDGERCIGRRQEGGLET